MVYVRTRGINQNGTTVLDYVLWVMVRKNRLDAPAPDAVVPALAKVVAPETLVIPAGLDFSRYEFALAGEPHRWGDYAIGDLVGRTIYAPVARSHRVTLKQFALLEPGLSETVNGSLMKVLRMAMDEVVRKGVSYDCARDFLLGHMNIMGAVMFDQHKGVFSDAANKAIEFGIPVLMKDDWLRCFDDDEIAASVERIT